MDQVANRIGLKPARPWHRIFWPAAGWLLVVSAFSTASSAPPRPFTIVTFGDSTTALRRGCDVYTTQLGQRLASAPMPVRLVNRGRPSDSTKLARKRFAADVLAEKPDLVIVQFGINDANVDVWRSPPASTANVSVPSYEENLRYFSQQVRQTGAKIIFMTPNQMRWTPKLLRLYSHAPYDPQDARGMTPPMDPYVQAVRRIAQAEGVPMVDVYDLFARWELTHGQSCAALLSDGMHPNTAGHTLIADALLPLVTADIAEVAHLRSAP